jgi:transcriptional regulator
MYIPSLNSFDDTEKVIKFMQRFSFATLITAKNNIPVATHLPFVVKYKDDTLTLISHIAKANNQWQDLEDTQVLVIFSEPHAYISPTHYTKELEVPTWNYISVHAYGKTKILTQTHQIMELLENMIDNYEKEYQEKWKNFPQNYKLNMIKGIVAFEIEITDLQAKKKLSQNKTEKERTNIITAFSKSDDSNEKLIAEYMKENKE